MMRTILFALLLAACGGGAKNAPSPGNETQPAAGHETPPPEAATEGDIPTSCDDACTMYAVCYEDVYGGDFKGGGECVSSCEEKDEAAKKEYFKFIGESDCQKMMGDGGDEGEGE